jgi:hypothetical protein
VAARRLVILMLVLLGVSTIAAALVPVDRDAGTDETTTTTTSTPAEKRDDSGGKLVPGFIDAASRKPEVVRIELGDQLALRVTSRRNAEVEIPRIGELEDVGPDAPARFDLLPFEAGRYAVRLVEPRRTIGRIEVRRPAKEKPARKRSKERD